MAYNEPLIPPIRTQTGINFKYTAISLSTVFGYDHVYAESFTEDNHSDPGGAYTPATTDCIVNVNEAKVYKNGTSYYSDVIALAAAKNDAYLIVEYEGTAPVVKLHRDDHATNTDTLTLYTEVALGAAINSYRIEIEIGAVDTYVYSIGVFLK